MQSDDAMLRSLAMRGFMMTQSQIDFDIKYPGKWEVQYEKVVGDPAKLSEFFDGEIGKLAGNSNIPPAIHRGGRIVSIAFDLEADGMSGRAFTLDAAEKKEFNSGAIRVNGDLILFEIKFTVVGDQGVGTCKFKIMPPEKRLLLAEMKCGPLAYPISSEVR